MRPLHQRRALIVIALIALACLALALVAQHAPGQSHDVAWFFEPIFLFALALPLILLGLAALPREAHLSISTARPSLFDRPPPFIHQAA